MTIQAEPDYYGRVVQLAGQLRGFCRLDPSSEYPLFHPSNENGWTGPCDALSRLGVMERYVTLPYVRLGRPYIQVLGHRFTTHWNWGEPLPLHRHPGEPDYTDVLRSLCNFARFENLSLRAIGIDLRGGSSPETLFIEDLIARKLGSWSAENGFEFNADEGWAGYEAIDVDYWDARETLAKALGSEDALYPSTEAR